MADKIRWTQNDRGCYLGWIGRKKIGRLKRHTSPNRWLLNIPIYDVTNFRFKTAREAKLYADGIKANYDRAAKAAAKKMVTEGTKQKV
jgi:hypothetical protein